MQDGKIQTKTRLQGFGGIPTYQTRINSITCGLSNLPESEIYSRAISDESREPDKILRIRRNIRNASIVFPPEVSECCSLSPLDPESSPLYPANGGFRINERLHIGLRTRISLKFDNAGHLRKRGPLEADFSDLSTMYIGLPGQGEPGRSAKGIKCGFEKLKHGDICGTLEAETVIKRSEQFRHCNNINCPICWVRYYKDHANTTSSVIWDTRDMLARQGYTPMAYHIVLSCPQPFDKPSLIKSATLEGWKDLRAEAHEILRELGVIGGAMFYHPFRENGKDGIKNGSITGNDGDPEHWRYAPHFHAIALFNGFPPLDRVRELYERTGFVINFKTIEDERPKGANYLDEARIKTLADCSYLCSYLYSHIGVIKGDNSNRRLPGVTYLENSHPTKIRTLYLRRGVPLLLQGYTATVQDPDNLEVHGQPLYWRQLLLDLAASSDLSPPEILRLSEVELINSGFVRCAAHDYEYCSKVLDDEYKRQKELGLLHPSGHGKYDLDVFELWRLIRDDPAFITQFQPVNAELRNPRILQVDGEQLGYIFGSSEKDLYPDSPDYAAYCEDADRREAELMQELRSHLNRYKKGV